MGKRGPKPTPTGERTAGRRHPRPETPSASPAVESERSRRPPCPAWLSPAARKEWRRVVPHLEAMGTILQIDQAVIAAYCHERSEWERLEALVQQYGEILPSKNKAGETYFAHSPYIRLRNNARDAMLKAAVMLGLSPSARPAPTPQVAESERPPLTVPVNADIPARDPRELLRSIK